MINANYLDYVKNDIKITREMDEMFSNKKKNNESIALLLTRIKKLEEEKKGLCLHCFKIKELKSYVSYGFFTSKGSYYICQECYDELTNEFPRKTVDEFLRTFKPKSLVLSGIRKHKND